MVFKSQSAMILLAIISLLLGECQSPYHEIIVVPKSYVGYIVIIYGQEKGISEEFSGKSRLYNIPSNGILLTRFSNIHGWSELPKFYNGSILGSNEIPFVVEFENIPENQIYAFGGTSGVANKDLSGNEVVRFKHFYIGNKNQILKSIEKAEKLDIIKLTE